MDLKIDRRNGGWGTLLITAGLIALADNFAISDWYKVAALVIAGMIAFVFYYQERSDWVALIPVYILWAVAAVTAGVLGEIVVGEWIAIAVLLIIALPFLYAFFRDRKNWWALIPAYVLLLIALVIMGTEVIGLGDEYIAVILMFGFAVPFLYVYLKDQERWWALIPAYVFLLIGLIISLEEIFEVGGKFIAPAVLGGIGLPFLVVYFRNRDNWWALIPAYVLLALGTMVGLLEFRLLTGLVIPAFIMLAIAVPFFFVYLLNQRHGWALIPGGITALIGVGFLLGTDLGKYLLPAVLVLLGIWLLVRVFKK